MVFCDAKERLDLCCDACKRSEEILNTGKLTSEELLSALKWIDSRKCIENSELGGNLDNDWLEKFVSISWSPLYSMMAENFLRPYLLPINTDPNIPMQRLVGRLKRIASNPYCSDDDQNDNLSILMVMVPLLLLLHHYH